MFPVRWGRVLPLEIPRTAWLDEQLKSIDPVRLLDRAKSVYTIVAKLYSRQLSSGVPSAACETTAVIRATTPGRERIC